MLGMPPQLLPRSLSQAAGTSLVSLVSSLSPTSSIQASFVFHRSRWESILFSEIESSFLLKKAMREVFKMFHFPHDLPRAPGRLCKAARQVLGRALGAQKLRWGPCPLLLRGNRGWGRLREGRQGRQACHSTVCACGCTEFTLVQNAL